MSARDGVRVRDYLCIDSEQLVDGDGCRTMRRHPVTGVLEERQIDVCREWIRLHVQPTKTIRPRMVSYGLKHRVEHWTRARGPYDQVDPWGRAWSGEYLYVSNGAFIVAALREGYVGERCGEFNVNCAFNMAPRKAATDAPSLATTYKRWPFTYETIVTSFRAADGEQCEPRYHCRALEADEARNHLVTDVVAARCKGELVLVVAPSAGHLDTLRALLEARGLRVGALLGSYDERAEACDAARGGRLDVLCARTGFGLQLDQMIISGVHVATFVFAAPGRARQSDLFRIAIGAHHAMRERRPFHVVDVVDIGPEHLRRSVERRGAEIRQRFVDAAVCEARIAELPSRARDGGAPRLRLIEGGQSSSREGA